MNHKHRRAISILLTLAICAGLLPLSALASNTVAYNEEAQSVEDGKYILIGTLDENGAIVDILGKAVDDGPVEQAVPFVPFLRNIAIEWNMEQTQEIRIEVVDENGFVLGYILEGEFRGQWGKLFGEQYDVHENVANRIIWDGTYIFDPEDADNCGEEYYPGESAADSLNEKIFLGKYALQDAIDEDGGIIYDLNGDPVQVKALVEGEYSFFIRRQPMHEDLLGLYLDMPIIVSYTERAFLENFNARWNQYNLGSVCDLVGDPVNIMTGNFTWDYTDIAVYGSQPLEFARLYNAQNGKGTEMGHNWRHNYLVELEDTELYARVTMPDGYRIVFTKNNSGAYSGPADVDMRLAASGGGFRMTYRDMTEYRFDGGGHLTSIVDVGGNVTTIARDGSRISTITNRSGTLTFAYSGGRITGVTDQTGRGVSYGYDGNGDLVSFLNADGDTIDYTYQGHLITYISDFNGNTYLANTYDDVDRVISQYMAGQGTTYFGYDFTNRVSVVTAPDGATARYYYDVNQRITAVEDACGRVGYEYTNGRVSMMTDRLGNTTSYTYDPAGNVTSVTHPDGISEHYEYNPLNLVTRYTARDGSVTLYGYDPRGNMTSYTDARSNTSTFTYDSNNNMLTSADAMGNTSSFTYDPRGNMLTQTDPLGNTTSFAYDTQGRLVLQVNPDGGAVEYGYSDAGKLVRVTDPDGNEQDYSVTGNGFNDGSTDPMGFSTSTVYNEQNQPISITDAEGNTTTYGYDSVGHLVTVTDALGNSVRYGYDLAGRMTSYTDARGSVWSYSYDSEGRMTATSDPLNNSTSSVFDSMGRVTSGTNARNATTSYQYDAAGRTTRVTDALGNYSRSVFDANGNLIEQFDKNGNKWEYVFDINNRMIEARDPLGFVTSYVYDANGQCTRTVSALGAQPQSSFDNMGRLIRFTDAEGNETEYGYDILGRLVKVTFADGTSTGNEYNANGWLISSTAPDGGVTEYTYNNNGQILTITDALGGVMSYVYDPLGRLTSVTDALGGTTRYVFDANGNNSAVTDALGNATAYIYDALNRVVSITDPMGDVTKIEYDTNSNVTGITTVDGGAIACIYDLLDRLTSVTDPEGYSLSFVFDANGNTTGATDGRGNSSSTAYDALNRAVSSTDAAGGVSSVTYDADGRVISATNPEGAVTNYAYDLNGNIVLVTDALGNGTALAYDSMNRVSSMTDAKGTITSYTYTATGQIETVTDAFGGVRSFGYDLLGRLVSETNELGNSTTYTFDALGRVLTVTDPLGDTDSFAYDALGRITSVTDKNGNQTRYNYDANGNIIETIDALNHSSYFEYDEMNRLVKVEMYRIDTRHNVNEQQVTLYQYDHRGLVTREINAAGNETVYVYDGNGNMVQKTDADGYVTEYGYDPRNLVESINYSDGKAVLFTYNANGELVAMQDWNGTTSFALDLLGRITSVNDHNNRAVSYTYDSVGNQTSITYPDNTVANYEYDLLGRLMALTDAEDQTTNYLYNAASQLVSLTYPNGWVDAFTYDAAGQLLRQYSTDPSNASNKAVEWSYTYDPNGNILTEYHNGSHGMGRLNLAHTYDALNRLTGTTGDQGFQQRSYRYDSLGNLTYEQVHNKGTEYWYNELNQQVQKVVDGKDTYVNTFDLRGNLVQSAYRKNQNQVTVTGAYSYDATNRMVRGTNEAGETSEYTYNGLGRLVANDMTFANNGYGYHGNHVRKDYVLDYTSHLADVIMEYEGGDSGHNYRFTYGLRKSSVVIYGIPSGVGSTAQTFDYPDGTESVVKLWYHHDRLGSTAYLTDNTAGAVSSFVGYDDWGAPTMKSIIRLGSRDLDLVTNYTGHPYDPVLGVYYARARMYDAADRRFIATDLYWSAHNRLHVANQFYLSVNEPDFVDLPELRLCILKPDYLAISQSGNLYVYCMNNPLLYIDPEGESVTLTVAFTTLACAFAAFLAVELMSDSNFASAVDNALDRLANQINNLARRIGVASELIKNTLLDIVGAGGGSPNPNPNGRRSLNQLDGRQADRVAQRNGYRNAEDLKEAFVPRNGSRYNIYRDTNNGEIVLKSIQGNIQIPTGLYR